ncbi:MAG: NAD(P)-binding domain-containing protein [Anaerolineae bacterium]|nr:NAD(P)-binding domain-containing protein [Anaerolineae bacterium]
MSTSESNYNTIIIGGGQAGLATGYYLKQQGRDFTILDAHARTGDSWRNRWDSLHLFSPARYDELPGMSFPTSPHAFPTKDEMAEYLETYAARFDLPVQHGVRVDHLTRENGRFLVTAGERRFKADNVVVAMSNYQAPWVPPFARDLDPAIVQMHSSAYRNLDQLQDGGVLVVGAGNSGAEIALESVREHPTWISGRDVGHIPFRIETTAARYVFIPLVLRFLFHRVLTVSTPIGRKARPKMLGKGGPLVRVKPQDLTAAGIERVPKTAGVQNGLPVVGEGRILDVANVIWCTGFRSGFSWIDLPVFDDQEGRYEPRHERGIVSGQPGLYFVGLFFLYALSSSLVEGVERDAQRIVKHLVSRMD